MGTSGTTAVADEIYATVRSTSADDVAMILDAAQRVVFVPGYGMAVAQAQHADRDLANLLEKNGVNVEYAIHPVAGRMPGLIWFHCLPVSMRQLLPTKKSVSPRLRTALTQ